MHKCGFSKVVIGSSGGVDSALVTTLAAQALGPDAVKTLAMPTRYSSRHSLEDAEALAKNLGIEHQVVPIDDIFEAYLRGLEGPFGEEPQGLTAENLQSRIRGDVLMAVSNREGCLVLNTGNKSELAMGYCTLYGDMSRALAVISDVPKTLAYDLCRHINDGGEVIPERVLTKAPSAELAPDQKDTDSLPPYPLLDAIIEGYVVRELPAEALIDQGLDAAVVHRVIRAIDLNEYKRWQAAPGLRITPKAFGVGRRLPLAAAYRNLSSNL